MNRKNTGDDEVFLGQKGKVKRGEDWFLSIGRAQGGRGRGRGRREVKLDCTSPHVIFVCGARGSGKSYTLGVLGEEIARKNSDIAAVIVDPIGVFWSMKYPNQEEGEIELLRKVDMSPSGMEDVRIFVPTGFTSEIPGKTFDTDFSIRPSGLTVEDWCLTFGIDRYSPQGLLLERAIEKVKEGYTRKLGDKLEGGSRDVAPQEDFSIDDLLACINHDRELLSKKKGFRGSTRRALSSRLRAAKEWGIFGRGKSLSDLIRPGMISVFDISFLPQNIGSLVLGILARKILAARKAAAREEALRDLTDEGGMESGTASIPPLWLMVDEAHNFAPSSGKTAASDPLVEYIKQGRRPGLSAVLSTQQPSALNSKIISQLDILLSHRLTFNDDIKEVRKRFPTTLPDPLGGDDSLKGLPEGKAVVADGETGRAFVVSIRPRLSQHEGRERVSKYSGEEPTVRMLEGGTKGHGARGTAAEDLPPEGEEALVVPFQVNKGVALSVAESERDRLLGILWPKEKVRRTTRRYYPIWSALIDYYPQDAESMNIRIHVDGITGELIQKIEGKLKRTRGARKLTDLDSSEGAMLLKILKNRPLSQRGFEDSLERGWKIKTVVASLADKELIKIYEVEEGRLLDLGEGVDIPASLSDETFLEAEEVPERETLRIPPDEREEPTIGEEKMLETLKFFGDIEIVERELFHYPYWTAELTSNGDHRIVCIDGVSGRRDAYVERMLRRRP